MPDATDLGKLINDARVRRGYSLGQLANLVGVTAADVRSWETNAKAPEADMLRRLSSELGLEDRKFVDAVPAPAVPPVPSANATPTSGTLADPATKATPSTSAPTGAPVPAAAPTERRNGMGDRPGGDEDATAAVMAPVFSDAGDTGLPVDHAAPAPGIGDGSEPTGLGDLPTEAVEVVPPSPWIDPVPPSSRATASGAAVGSRPRPQSMATSGALAPFTAFFATLFDPNRRYLFWVRTVLTVVVIFVMFRILATVVPAFFDTLGDILDTIESTTETTIVDPLGGEPLTVTTVPAN